MPLKGPAPHLKLGQPSSETSRWEGTTASQQHGCSTVWASWVQSTGPLQRLEWLYNSPRGKGQKSAHSPLRHWESQRIDEPPQPSRVPTGVAHTEATSIKWPQGGSLMKQSYSMWRHSYIGGRQQQCQSLPQRGQTQGELHSKTPSRSPSRIPPCSQCGDEQLHHSSSCPQLQAHQESPGEGVHLTQPGIALMCTARCSYSWEPTVKYSSKSPAQKLVMFDLPNLDDLGNAQQLLTD